MKICVHDSAFRCKLPDILGVDNYCKKCGDVGLVIDAIDKHPELFSQA